MTPSLEGWCSIQLSYGQIEALNGRTVWCGAMVGVERFELPTSCSQSRRATRLRYTPRARDDSTRPAPDYAACGTGALGAAMTRAVGSTAEKVLPWPISDWTSRRPLWRISTCLTIARPSPVPPVSRDRLLSTR